MHRFNRKYTMRIFIKNTYRIIAMNKILIIFGKWELQKHRYLQINKTG